jgi:hypothetical protein
MESDDEHSRIITMHPFNKKCGARRRFFELPGGGVVCAVLVLCFWGFSPGSVAQDIPVANEPKTPSPVAVNEQASDAEPQLRDPFWPVGFVPSSGRPVITGQLAPEKGKEPAGQTGDASGMLRIGGVVKKGGIFFATINGSTVKTGEVVAVVSDGEVYKFVVETIDFKKVQVKPLKQ